MYHKYFKSVRLQNDTINKFTELYGIRENLRENTLASVSYVQCTYFTSVILQTVESIETLRLGILVKTFLR